MRDLQNLLSFKAAQIYVPNYVQPHDILICVFYKGHKLYDVKGLNKSRSPPILINVMHSEAFIKQKIFTCLIPSPIPKIRIIPNFSTVSGALKIILSCPISQSTSRTTGVECKCCLILQSHLFQPAFGHPQWSIWKPWLLWNWAWDHTGLKTVSSNYGRGPHLARYKVLSGPQHGPEAYPQCALFEG